MKTKFRFFSLLFLSLILAVSAVGAMPATPARAAVNIIYVNDDASGAGTGVDWTNAYKKLQNALDAAVSGDEIWVAAGVYYPDEGTTPINNNRSESFHLINGVAIYGGFDPADTLLIDRDPTANVTILSGDLEQNDTNTDGNNIAEDVAHIQGSNAYNVVSATFPNVDNSAVLDGFVITAGVADGSPLQNTTVGGGVRLITGNNPTLANLTIIGNDAFANGGGMFASDNSNPALTNVAFYGNDANNGGGFYADDSNPTLNDVTFSGNTANNGGGMSAVATSTAMLTNVVFTNNSAAMGGGGMFISNSVPTLTDVTFSLNSAAIGGGLQIGVLSNPALTNVTITQNNADYGAGIYLLGNTGSSFAYMTANNVTISANDATLLGGGLYGYYGNATFVNVTFSGNSAGTSGGGLYNTEFSATYFTNVIVANSVGGDCVNVNNSDSVRYNSLFESAANACGATNNVDGNRTGVDPLLGPLQNNGGLTDTHALLSASPAIDTGASNGYLATDQRGGTRPLDGDTNGSSVSDMGAFEFNPSPTVLTINRVNPNPTALASVDFTVTFSESVNNVDASDFLIWQSGVSGATVGGVSGSGATRTVSVQTGAGSGAVRLDVKSSGTGIVDATSNPLNGGFTSGQTYTVDKTSPAVASITRADESPTARATVDFIVAFAEAVTGVDAADFSLVAPGLSGAAISGVNGSGASYTVTVDTGTGSGSIRLDLNSSGTGIVDAAGNAISGGFTSGQTYTVDKTETFRSQGVNDGWVLESTETSAVGGSLNSTATTFRLGDAPQNKQYRAILDFDTSALPDGAVITRVTLKIKQSGSPSGTNPFTILNALKVDIRKPRFGNSAALANNDFQATASQANIGAIANAPVSGWYARAWNAGAFFTYINKTGSTQFRLYFSRDDDNDNSADFMRFFSGNAGTASRPQLIVEFYVP